MAARVCRGPLLRVCLGRVPSRRLVQTRLEQPLDEDAVGWRAHLIGSAPASAGVYCPDCHAAEFEE